MKTIERQEATRLAMRDQLLAMLSGAEEDYDEEAALALYVRYYELCGQIFDELQKDGVQGTYRVQGLAISSDMPNAAAMVGRASELKWRAIEEGTHPFPKTRSFPKEEDHA